MVDRLGAPASGVLAVASRKDCPIYQGIEALGSSHSKQQGPIDPPAFRRNCGALRAACG
jgi:hypothetical protein